MDIDRSRPSPNQTEIQELLESLLACRGFPPDGFQRIFDCAELPARLRYIAGQASPQGATWAACGRDLEITFYVAEPAANVTRRKNKSAILVTKFDERGKVCDVSAWVYAAVGRWERNVS